MKKLTTILLTIIALSSFGQYQFGDFVNLNLRARMYSNQYNLISEHPDSSGQFLFENAADPETMLGLVNLRYLESNYMASEVIDDSLNAKLSRDVPEYVLNLENLYLTGGGDREIMVGGNFADNLLIRAGDGSYGAGGGDLTLRGGGLYDHYGDVLIGSGESLLTIADSTSLSGKRIKDLAPGIDPTDAVNVSQIEGLIQSVYSIGLPYSTTVAGRVAGPVIYGSGTEEWELSAGVNSIDLEITHGLGRRVANINVCTVSGTAEQLLRPFAGAYSGWQTTDENTLLINSLATTPLPLKIYIIFE